MVPKEKMNDDVKYVCTIVHPAADIYASYKRFMAKQMVLEGEEPREVLKLDYDIHTRYYLNGD